MSRDYGVVEVIHRPTGEKRLIKWERFNPEIHKQIGDIHSAEYAINYDKPVHLQQDMVGVAVVDAEVKAEKQKQSTESVATVQETPADRLANAFDPAVDLPVEEIEKLPMFQLRQYAKHRGIKASAKLTKQDLLAQVGSLNTP